MAFSVRSLRFADAAARFVVMRLPNQNPFLLFTPRGRSSVLVHLLFFFLGLSSIKLLFTINTINNYSTSGFSPRTACLRHYILTHDGGVPSLPCV